MTAYAYAGQLLVDRPKESMMPDRPIYTGHEKLHRLGDCAWRSPTCEIRNATDLEVANFYGSETTHKVMLVNGEPVAMTHCSRVNGRLWVMLKVNGQLSTQHASKLFWAARHKLREIGADEPAYTVCQFPSAERFLATLGFVPTDETLDGHRVWMWTSEHSR